MEEDLVIGIQSTKTYSVRPLEPLERDLMSAYSLMYEGLMTINDDYLPECNLAAEYSSSNGKTWTFILKDNLTFSDGSPVTADDVVATGQWILEKAKSEDSDTGYYANLRYFVSSFSAKDPKTVVVKAERPYYGLLYAMTFPVLPAWALEMDNPPGTGAYICESLVPKNTMQLAPNPNWRGGAPQVKSILFVMHENASAVIDAYEYARVDAIFTRSIASAQYKSGVASLALDYRTNQLECLLMNHSAFPLNNQAVREAIRYLIDVNKISNNIYNGMVERTDTPFINGTWMYNENLDSYFVTNPAKAVALLESIGWSDVDEDGILERLNDEGEYVELKMNLFVYEEPDNDVRLETANYIRDTLNSYGFNVSITTKGFTDIQQDLSSGNFHLCLASYAMDPCPDAGFMLMNYNTGNYCRYRSSAMTDLCNSLRKQLNQSDYQRVLWQIQEQFAKDCPFICLFYRSGTVLTRRMYTTTRDVRELELLKGIENFTSD